MISIISNPNNVLLGNIGDFFYRSGSAVFHFNNDFTQQPRIVNNVKSFIGKYRSPFYNNTYIKFQYAEETWQKISGNNTNTGWIFIGGINPFTVESVIVIPVTPTPTPTPSPTSGLTPTPTPTSGLTPTPSSTSGLTPTPTPTPSPTGELMHLGIDKLESYPNGIVN